METNETSPIQQERIPRWYEPSLLIMSCLFAPLGAIIGIELMLNTGIVSNTSIFGALLAVLVSMIPMKFFRRYRSKNYMNMLQTAMSGPTYAAANAMFMPTGVVLLLGRTDLLVPMLIGCFFAMIVDVFVTYKSFDTEMFPAASPWPSGLACGRVIQAITEKGTEAIKLLIGIAMGVVGKMCGIPMDMVGVSWIARPWGIFFLATGGIIMSVIKGNGLVLSLFGRQIVNSTGWFGADFVYSNYTWLTYMGHGIMIGAAIVSLVQCFIMLFKPKGEGSGSAMAQFASGMAEMKKGLSKGFIAYIIFAAILAVITGIFSEMGTGMLILWIIYAAIAALVSSLIVGVAVMNAGWFPAFATALVFLLGGMAIGFPTIPCAVLVGYTAATGPGFADLGFDLKCGWMVRGCGADPEYEKDGRKQQFFIKLVSICIALVVVLLIVNNYIAQDRYIGMSRSYVATINAGSIPGLWKCMALWAVVGAIVQILGKNKQLGIMLATGLVVVNALNGFAIYAGLIVRYFVAQYDKKHPEKNAMQNLTILAAGSFAGAAMYSFFTSTLSIFKKK